MPGGRALAPFRREHVQRDPGEREPVCTRLGDRRRQPRVCRRWNAGVLTAARSSGERVAVPGGKERVAAATSGG